MIFWILVKRKILSRIPTRHALDFFGSFAILALLFTVNNICLKERNTSVGLLDKQATVAKPGFNRWLVPPAALAVHLCIGQAYAFSVFNIPLAEYGNWSTHWWNETSLIFAIAIFFLGVSAAFGGRWLERAGPRKAMFTSACLFSGGFFVSALGIYLENLWIIFLGYGVLSGCGLGLGYVSPVSTLIKWFPDRRGLAAGLAIMGFGGGAMIGAPLGESLMRFYSSNIGLLPAAITDSHGLMGTFLTMGTIYFFSMAVGAMAIRIPAEGWMPKGWTPPVAKKGDKKAAMMTQNHVHVNSAHKTPQFWLLWSILFLNVTAGIGVLSQASPMIQHMFSVETVVAAGFVGLLSFFNMAGRVVWSPASDYIGRKNTYYIILVGGMICYLLITPAQVIGSMMLFIVLCAFIMSFYGSGFSTIPAYLADMFGTRFVGAIHGRLLTAWSLAGLSGAMIVNGLTRFRLNQNAERVLATIDDDPAIREALDTIIAASTETMTLFDAAIEYVRPGSYDLSMYAMAILLLIGAICNFLMRPVHAKHHMTQKELERER